MYIKRIKIMERVHHFHDDKTYRKSLDQLIFINWKNYSKIGRKNIVNANEYLLYKKNKTFKKSYMPYIWWWNKISTSYFKSFKKHSIKAFFCNTKYIECNFTRGYKIFMYNFCKGLINFIKFLSKTAIWLWKNFKKK